MIASVRPSCRVATGLAFVVAGLGHLAGPERLVPIIPPYLPWPVAIVVVSGVLEIAGGLGLLVRRCARTAAVGLSLLLTSFLPANLHMAMNGAQIPGFPMPSWVLWLRIPFLIVFFAWFAWCVADIRPGSPPEAGPGPRDERSPS